MAGCSLFVLFVPCFCCFLFLIVFLKPDMFRPGQHGIATDQDSDKLTILNSEAANLIIPVDDSANYSQESTDVLASLIDFKNTSVSVDESSIDQYYNDYLMDSFLESNTPVESASAISAGIPNDIWEQLNNMDEDDFQNILKEIDNEELQS